VLLAVMVGMLCALVWVAPAEAHNSLTASSPADGARVATVPRTVTLTFLAGLKPAGTAVTVAGPDGVEATAGAPSVKRNTVTVRLRPGAAGRYTVTYRVASTDGHPVKGDIQFTASAGVTTAPATGTAASPAAPPQSGPAQSGPAQSGAPESSSAPTAPSGAAIDRTAASPAAEEPGATWWPWAVGATLLVAAGAATYLVRRRAR
jgi:hypothetical protein